MVLGPMSLPGYKPPAARPNTTMASSPSTPAVIPAARSPLVAKYVVPKLARISNANYLSLASHSTARSQEGDRALRRGGFQRVKTSVLARLVANNTFNSTQNISSPSLMFTTPPS